MLVEALGGLILGVNQDGKYAQLGTRRAEHCVTQKNTAKTLSLVTPGHRQAPQ
jgi:hypothetical protein